MRTINQSADSVVFRRVMWLWGMQWRRVAPCRAPAHLTRPMLRTRRAGTSSCCSNDLRGGRGAAPHNSCVRGRASLAKVWGLCSFKEIEQTHRCPAAGFAHLDIQLKHPVTPRASPD